MMQSCKNLHKLFQQLRFLWTFYETAKAHWLMITNGLKRKLRVEIFHWLMEGIFYIQYLLAWTIRVIGLRCHFGVSLKGFLRDGRFGILTTVIWIGHFCIQFRLMSEGQTRIYAVWVCGVSQMEENKSNSYKTRRAGRACEGYKRF